MGILLVDHYANNESVWTMATLHGFNWFYPAYIDFVNLKSLSSFHGIIWHPLVQIVVNQTNQYSYANNDMLV